MPLGFPVLTSGSSSFLLWFIGFRFGEADHPGPRRVREDSTLTLAVVNPTTILDKEWHFNQIGADVIIASETSANAQVQRIMSHRFRGLGYRCVWGHPTETRHHLSTGRSMLRSYALGVALLSKGPCRPAVQPLPDIMATAAESRKASFASTASRSRSFRSTGCPVVFLTQPPKIICFLPGLTSAQQSLVYQPLWRGISIPAPRSCLPGRPFRT